MTCSWSVLGEAFLKFFLATYFFSRHAFEMEGPLTTRIQNESDPAILSSYLRSSGLLGNVRTYAHYTEKTAGRYLCQVVGAAAFFGSVDSAIKVARTLGLVFDSSTNSMENIFNLYSFYLSNLRIPPAMRDDWILGKIERVQEILGYKFSDKGLLLEAICHGVSQSLSSTFQRIEFLGDAVLEYVVADHYLRKYPRMPMEDFRAYKSLILCNSALGCLFLALGLERYFDSGSRWPGSDWRLDTRNVIQNLNNGSDWIHIRPNKKLADGMEAIVGAIFIDSKFMIGPVENVLRRTLYPFIDNSMLATKIGARKRLLSSVLDN
ncbi:Dicer-like protein 1 [Haplosporangium sp. Z 27]|nr:Dicer-like protein 1 [Haplosporangium sp. Z 27]